MAKRIIVLDGDPILRKKCKEVTEFDKKLHSLLDDMYETMIDADGVGLAGPQVGVLRRIAVVGVDEGERIELINPKITMTEGENVGQEGCLSYPGLWGIVSRPMNVTVEAQDRFGNKFTVSGTGLKARAFCHEIDHLDGKVYVDIATELHKDGESEHKKSVIEK